MLNFLRDNNSPLKSDLLNFFRSGEFYNKWNYWFFDKKDNVVIPELDYEYIYSAYDGFMGGYALEHHFYFKFDDKFWKLTHFPYDDDKRGGRLSQYFSDEELDSIYQVYYFDNEYDSGYYLYPPAIPLPWSEEFRHKFCDEEQNEIIRLPYGESGNRIKLMYREKIYGEGNQVSGKIVFSYGHFSYRKFKPWQKWFTFDYTGYYDNGFHNTTDYRSPLFKIHEVNSFFNSRTRKTKKRKTK